jgi:hypothetical protein
VTDSNVTVQEKVIAIADELICQLHSLQSRIGIVPIRKAKRFVWGGMQFAQTPLNCGDGCGSTNNRKSSFADKKE